MSKELQKKAIIITATQPEDPNDLGNGWTNGYKNFKDLWDEPKDADFEVIPDKTLNKKIEWSEATPENYDGKNNRLSICILDEAGVWKNQKPD